MDRKEFDRLEIMAQIQYINDLLKAGESLRNISANLNMSKTTIRDRFQKIDYYFDKDVRQYVKNIENKRPDEKIQKEYKNISNNNSPINKWEKDILELIEMKDQLKKLIENNNKSINENDLNKELKINIEALKGNTVNRSVKIYNTANDMLQELYSSYPQFKKFDLLSMAILEFYNKYKKD